MNKEMVYHGLTRSPFRDSLVAFSFSSASAATFAQAFISALMAAAFLGQTCHSILKRYYKSTNFPLIDIVLILYCTIVLPGARLSQGNYLSIVILYL